MAGSQLQQGKVDLFGLVARIKDEFPDLRFDRAVLNDDGEDHAVVFLDESWVFRFPRSPAAARYAAGERRLLERLNAVSPLATPLYEMTAAHGVFAGYRLIRGQSLSERLFASLARPIQERLVDELGGFLGCLHALPIDLIAPTDGGPAPAHTGSAFAADYWRRREVIAAGLAPELRARVDRFYEVFPAVVDQPAKVLIHGDLSEDHILLAPDGEQLAGVIDFTDAGPGDAAFDFCFLWAYGEWAPARAGASYGAGEEARKVVERSRWWWTRYSVDRLWWDLTGARAYDTQMLLGHISRSLTSLGF
ncbi:MAG TPA: aminoglycoside phosphotransferase family protein [Caulobacteraceae bacterium]